MSNKIALSKKSVNQLIKLRDQVDRQIASKAAAEVAELEKRIQELKSFSASHSPEIAQPAQKKPRTTAAKRRKPRKVAKPKLKLVETPKSAKATKAKSTKRKPIGKAPIKFRDPKTGDTWSGRGRTPVWLRSHEEAGRKRQKYAVAS
ncbi:MAG: H-NS family nucleoid-associated regulatory protein [Pseudomonadota bacterium]